MNKQWPSSLKRTKNREAIYQVLEKAHHPLSLQDILDALKEQKVEMWLSTLYRVLTSLQEAHLITKTTLLDNTPLYEIRLAGHSHYAICTNCHKVIELDHCLMEKYENQLSQHNFQITGHKIEIYGLCSSCRQQ